QALLGRATCRAAICQEGRQRSADCVLAADQLFVASPMGRQRASSGGAEFVLLTAHLASSGQAAVGRATHRQRVAKRERSGARRQAGQALGVARRFGGGAPPEANVAGGLDGLEAAAAACRADDRL